MQEAGWVHVRTQHHQEWMWEPGRRRKSFGSSMEEEEGEAGQEKGLRSSTNRRDPQPFAPCLLLIQEAQRNDDA